MLPFSIRHATPDDAEAITHIINPIIEAGNFTAMLRPYTTEEQRQYMLHFPAKGVFLVAQSTKDQTLLGLQSIEPESPEEAFEHVGAISTFVDLNLRRSGIGQRLTQASLNASRDVGFRKLMAMVRADNPQAAAFYRRQGFQQIGVAKKHAYLNGHYIDELLLERWLG